ncbi:MAG: ABC transporter permease subunit, partial [Thermoanaerobaculia bacterium]
ELLLHLLSARFVFSVVVATTLMLCGGWVLLRNYEDRVRAYNELNALHETQVGSYETGADTPLDALSMGGRILDRKPPALSFLFAGVYDSLPKSFWVSSFDGPVPETNLVENRLSDLFGLLDVRFVIGTVFSLLALLLSYDAVSGERQAGTLRLVFANPVRIRDLLIAKWVSLNAVLGAAFLIAFLAALLLALFSPAVSLGSGELARLGLVVLVSLLYLSVFVTLGLLLSSLFAEPYAAIAMGLMIWVLLVFVIPGAAPYVASLSEPGPDYVATALQRQDSLGFNYRAIRQKYLDQGQDRETAARLADEEWRKTVEPQLGANLLRANEDFLNGKERLIGRGRNLARLSPYASYSFAVSDLSGTGLAEQSRFEAALEEYRRQFQEFIHGQQEAGRKSVDPADLPVFAAPRPSSGAAFRNVTADVASLALLAIVLFGASYVRMLRYDVR